MNIIKVLLYRQNYGFVPLRNIIQKRTVDESNMIIQLKLNGISY